MAPDKRITALAESRTRPAKRNPALSEFPHSPRSVERDIPEIQIPKFLPMRAFQEWEQVVPGVAQIAQSIRPFIPPDEVSASILEKETRIGQIASQIQILLCQ